MVRAANPTFIDAFERQCRKSEINKGPSTHADLPRVHQAVGIKPRRAAEAVPTLPMPDARVSPRSC